MSEEEDKDENEANKPLYKKIMYASGVMLGVFIVMLGIATMITAAIFMHGLAIKLMWGWFVVPLGLSSIGFVHAIGLGLFTHYLTWKQVPKPEDEDAKDIIYRRLITIFVYPVIVIAFGAVAHTFI